MENGADTFPGGPVFDNAYHDFLINTIVANDAFSFATNPFPFDLDFGDWFADVDTIPGGVSHLGKYCVELNCIILDRARTLR